MLVGVAVVLALIFVPIKKEKRFDARITLNTKDKIPFGTNVSYSLLSKLFPTAKVSVNKDEPGSWKKLDEDTNKQVLIIVAKNFAPTEDELDYIIGFAQKGNYVFISAINYNSLAGEVFKIRQEFNNDYPFILNNDVTGIDSFFVKFDSSTFHQPLSFSCPGYSYDNSFTEYDSSFTYPLGYSMKGSPNLLAMHTIDGTIYLHSAPLTFSNLFVLYKNNYKYLEQIASLVPVKPTQVVWDEYYLYSRKRNDTKPEGLLSIMLAYPNFKWAFWITLIVLGIYVITESKRKQRQIPEYKKPANEHMEFIYTVGKLYFEKGDHLNLAAKMTQFFLEHIRSKYKISTAYINADFSTVLSMKTGITKEEADSIVHYIQQTQMGSINQDDLQHFYNHLENFYKKA